MTDQDKEVNRAISYIRSCMDAGIDTMITIDKNRNHLILNALEEFKTLKENNLTGLELAKIFATVKTLEKYEEIGTVRQFREATEYRNPVTPKLESHYYICPRCGSSKNIMLRSKFCSECGQAFK